MNHARPNRPRLDDMLRLPVDEVLALADNQIALNSGWDEALLVAELARIREDGFDLNRLPPDMKRDIPRVVIAYRRMRTSGFR